MCVGYACRACALHLQYMCTNVICARCVQYVQYTCNMCVLHVHDVCKVCVVLPICTTHVHMCAMRVLYSTYILYACVWYVCVWYVHPMCTISYRCSMHALCVENVCTTCVLYVYYMRTMCVCTARLLHVYYICALYVCIYIHINVYTTHARYVYYMYVYARCNHYIPHNMRW